MIQVTLTPELARLLHQYGDMQHVPPGDAKPFNKLSAFLKRTQSTLRPTFPNISDESMFHYFELITTKPLPNTAQEQLLAMPGVEGAYSKPDDEPPGPP